MNVQQQVFGTLTNQSILFNEGNTNIEPNLIIALYYCFDRSFNVVSSQTA